MSGGLTRCVACSLLFCLTLDLAHAQEGYEADVEYRAGQAAQAQHRDAEAVAHFSRANRLHPTALLTCLIADSLIRLNRVREAFNTFQEFAESSEAEPACEAPRRRLLALQGSLSVLQIALDPAAAELFVDGESFGHSKHTPRRVAVRMDAGDRRGRAVTIAASRDHYRPASMTLDMQPGQLRQVALALVPRHGSVHVTSAPSGANVRREGQSQVLGQTPYTGDWPEGPARVVIEAPGRLEALREGMVRDQQRLDLHAELERDPALLAALSVRTTPAGAAVYVDHELMGHTPWIDGRLEPGERALRVVRADREAWSTRVRLAPGATTSVKADLAPVHTPAWPGWRWVGYGTGAAVFAAGIVTGVVATQAREEFFAHPDRESYDRVENLNLAADVMLGVGLVVLAAQATVDLLREPPERSRGKVETAPRR